MTKSFWSYLFQYVYPPPLSLTMKDCVYKLALYRVRQAILFFSPPSIFNNE